jgi:transcriptional regulator with XRE-family HTH domain
MNEDEKYKADVIKAFGKRVKQLRNDKGFTQLDLAIRTGLDPRQIGRIENGRGSSGLGTLAMLAKGFEMSLAELFEFKAEAEK